MGAAPTGRPRLADVAARAGVSLKTASRAVNGEPGVSAETAHRVAAAVRDLGFRPNHLARALAGRRASAALGLLLSSIADPFGAAVAGVVEQVLVPRRLHLMSASHGDDPARQAGLVSSFVERRVDGLLLMPCPGEPGDELAREVTLGLPVVALDRPLPGIDVDTVVAGTRAATAAVVQGLAREGHRRIAFVAHTTRVWTLAERLAGYHEGLTAAGLPHDPALVEQHCPQGAAAGPAVARLLGAADPPTAVLVGKNGLTDEVQRRITAGGRAVAVAAFDVQGDVRLLARPPRVVVRSRPERLGAVAGEFLLERLDGFTGPGRTVQLGAETEWIR